VKCIHFIIPFNSVCNGQYLISVRIIAIAKTVSGYLFYSFYFSFFLINCFQMPNTKKARKLRAFKSGFLENLNIQKPHCSLMRMSATNKLYE